MFERQLWAVLACPDCQSGLEDRDGAASCTGCRAVYPVSGGQLDLHLQAPKPVDVAVTVVPFAQASGVDGGFPRPIRANPEGGVVYDPEIHGHELLYGNGLTPELASWMPVGSSGQVVLDLGCGTRRMEPILRTTGMTYLGLDVMGGAPDVLGTAEALPLLDESVDFVFSLAVLAHIQHPWLACREVARVLRPDGLFIGTTHFLEPCHMQSRHHVSALGLADWLVEGGFEILELEANADWSGIEAIITMGYLPRRLRIARTTASAIDAAHRLYRRLHPSVAAPQGEGLPERFTGGFRFVARRAV